MFRISFVLFFLFIFLKILFDRIINIIEFAISFFIMKLFVLFANYFASFKDNKKIKNYVFNIFNLYQSFQNKKI